MKLTTFFMLIFLANVFIARGSPQEQVVTGNVTDAATGEALQGVNVLVENTLTGASTDVTGRFSLPKPAEGAIIVFSFVGYTTERISFAGQSVIDVALSQEDRTLDDVIVIGYGTIKKSDLTGSISSVSIKDIEKAMPANITGAIKGRVPGIMAASTSGAPGSEDIIRIRGIGTLNNNDPIYVIDGTIIDNTDPNNPAIKMRFLNPLDIESIEILKDASAQAIYGSRGANGVILISTRKGGEGLPKVTFSSTLGLGRITNIPEVLNPEEFRDYILNKYNNGYKRKNNISDIDSVVPLNILMNDYTAVKSLITEYDDSLYTDWFDELLRENVLSQNYYLSLSGGSKNAHYSASAGYLSQDGIIENYNYNKYSFRLNTDYVLGKNITLGENLGISFDTKKGNDDWGTAFNYAFWADPLVPLLKEEGMVDPSHPEYEYNKYNVTSITGTNPVLLSKLVNLQRTSLSMVGNIFAEIKLFSDLKFRSSYGFNIIYSDVSDYAPKLNAGTGYARSVSILTAANYRTSGWVLENTLTYNKRIKGHAITALLGTTAEHLFGSGQTLSKQNTPTNDEEMRTFNAATQQPLITGSYSISRMISYIGRINYSFRDRYLGTASLRRDGSSRFGPGHRWGNFPSFSAAWIISNEKFFKNPATEFISNFKLRAGWGIIGNISIPVNYGFETLIGTDAMVDNYIFGETVVTGYSLKSIGIPDITWETTEQTNFGIDIGFLKNTLSFSADYYIKNTHNMLLMIQAPNYSGYFSSSNQSIRPYINTAEMQNKGFELMTGYKGTSGDFTYSINLTAATFRNEVTKLGSGYEAIFVNPNRTEAGHPIGSFYGYVTDGIFQSNEEVSEHTGPDGTILQPNARAGDFRFKNLNGDEAIDVSDQTFIGNPWPKLTYGINLNLGFRSFDILLFAQGSLGNEIYMITNPTYYPRNTLKYFYERAWNGPGTSNSHPILSSENQNNNYRMSDFFIKDGSFMRIKNIQFGYNLPERITGRIKVSQCRFWIGGTNLFTLTKFPGHDPEVPMNITPTSYTGVDYYDWFPISREFQIGLFVTI